MKRSYDFKEPFSRESKDKYSEPLKDADLDLKR